MTLSNEAVEAAARSMCASDPNIRMGDAERIVQQRVNLEWREYIEPATAALTAALPLIRAQVLEEAAKVADRSAKLTEASFTKAVEFRHAEHQTHFAARNREAEELADAIRALKENHP